MENEANNVQIDYSQPYITQEEFLQSKGVDLAVELQNNDRQSNKVNRFIKDITDFVIGLLVKKYACNELNPMIQNFNELAEFRRKRFHYGMIEQIEYVLNNGLIHQDSGVNPDTGMIIDYSKILISQSAYNQFYLGAFCNIKREW